MNRIGLVASFLACGVLVRIVGFSITEDWQAWALIVVGVIMIISLYKKTNN